MRDPFNGIGDACGGSSSNEDFKTSVMSKSGTEIETEGSMRCPGLTSCRLVVYKNFGTCGSNGLCSEIMSYAVTIFCLITPIQGGISHDFRAQPFAPASTKVLVHDKPAARQSWTPHGTLGFYLGPALQRYRCFEVFISTTSATRVTDTVEWFPHGVSMPNPTPLDCATAQLPLLLISLQPFAR